MEATLVPASSHHSFRFAIQLQHKNNRICFADLVKKYCPPIAKPKHPSGSTSTSKETPTEPESCSISDSTARTESVAIDAKTNMPPNSPAKATKKPKTGSGSDSEEDAAFLKVGLNAIIQRIEQRERSLRQSLLHTPGDNSEPEQGAGYVEASLDASFIDDTEYDNIVQDYSQDYSQDFNAEFAVRLTTPAKRKSYESVSEDDSRFTSESKPRDPNRKRRRITKLKDNKKTDIEMVDANNNSEKPVDVPSKNKDKQKVNPEKVVEKKVKSEADDVLHEDIEKGIEAFRKRVKELKLFSVEGQKGNFPEKELRSEILQIAYAQQKHHKRGVPQVLLQRLSQIVPFTPHTIKLYIRKALASPLDKVIAEFVTCVKNYIQVRKDQSPAEEANEKIKDTTVQSEGDKQKAKKNIFRWTQPSEELFAEIIKIFNAENQAKKVNSKEDNAPDTSLKDLFKRIAEQCPSDWITVEKLKNKYKAMVKKEKEKSEGTGTTNVSNSSAVAATSSSSNNNSKQNEKGQTTAPPSTKPTVTITNENTTQPSVATVPSNTIAGASKTTEFKEATRKLLKRPEPPKKPDTTLPVTHTQLEPITSLNDLF